MATQIPNNLFSHKTCLSNEDLDTLYQIYDGVISRQFIGQVAKAHNFSGMYMNMTYSFVIFR